MAKSKQELEAIKSRVEELSTVLQELSEDELSVVFGGMGTGAFLRSGIEESWADLRKVASESSADLR